MDIQDMNNTIIEGIKNAIHKGPDDAVEFAGEMYQNSNNDFFLSSRGFAEEVLFRTFEYGIFHMSMPDEVDYSRYVLDNEYRGLIHKKRLESFDDEIGIIFLSEGSENFQAGNIKEAVEAYKKAAVIGNVKAMYEYGLFLCEGEGSEKDELLGSYWYWEAAQGGEVRAMYNLGVNYREGVGVKQNMPQMLYWYAKSASAMCSEAIYSLGYSLMDGEVLSGEDVYSIGRTMLRAAGDIEMNSRAQQFVVNNCEAIIDILKESGKIFNG